MGRHFLWDPISDNIVKEFDDAGNTIADYTTEPFRHGSLISQHRDGVSRFHHFDGQGNTTSLTDKDGNVTDTYAYNAFGEVTERTGSTVNPFQFVGQFGYYSDELTGTVMVRQNTLPTASGRWLSPDAAIFGSSYAYVHNNPCFFIDPSGLLSQKVPPENELPDDIRGWIKLQNPYNGPCISFGLVTVWELEQDEREGFIIQRVRTTIANKISNRCNPNDDLAASQCPSPKFSLPPGAPRKQCDEYLEIWRVHNGRVYSNNVFGQPFQVTIGWGIVNGVPVPIPQAVPQWTQEDPFDIFANFGFKVGTKGHLDEIGEAIFVSLKSLQVPSSPSFAGTLESNLWPTFQPGNASNAGGLASACGETQLWNELVVAAGGVGKISNKKLTKDWNCCAGEKRKSTLTINIDGKSFTDMGKVLQVDGEPDGSSPAYGLWCRKTDC